MNDVRQDERASVEDVDEEHAGKRERMIEEADQEIHAVRASFRWMSPQVAVVKRAAARFGVPYQTYIKQVVFRQALADLDASTMVDDTARSRH